MRHGIILITLGFALIGIGVVDRGWLLVAVWLGADFVVVGIAHLRGWHHVFGKRPDGTLPVWSWLVFLPLLVYTSGVWHLMRLFSREPAQNTVTPDLKIGRRLLPSEVQEKFDNYVDLTAEFLEPASIRKSPGYLCFPILDASAPDPAGLRKAIERLRPGKTFIHCAQGHGRTGLFATAVLLASGKARTVDECLRMLQNVRPRIRLRRAQRRCVENFAATAKDERRRA